MQVKFNGLDLQYQRLRSKIDEAVSRVLASGYYIGGPEVGEFEVAFARWSGAAHAVAVANGTDAIAIALRSLGIGRGDEVIVPALSAYPTTVGVVQSGATPVFVDVDWNTGLMDVTQAAEAVTPATRAILPVHLYGTPCDVPELLRIARRHGVWLVEDCAQAHGARWAGTPVGTESDAAAWSFYPTKNLGAIGDAGAVTARAQQHAEKMRRMRNYGQLNRYEHVEQGWNSRLDPLQAAILRVKLEHLDEELEARRRIAARYDAALRGLGSVEPLQVAEGSRAARHLYPVRVAVPARRASLQTALADAGVETLVHYPIAMPDQKATPEEWRLRARCDVARRLAISALSLPCHPDLTHDQQEHVIHTVQSWARSA